MLYAQDIKSNNRWIWYSVVKNGLPWPDFVCAQYVLYTYISVVPYIKEVMIFLSLLLLNNETKYSVHAYGIGQSFNIAIWIIDDSN